MRIATILGFALLAACATEPPPRPTGPEPLPATPIERVERQSLAPPPGVAQAPAPSAEPQAPLPLGPQSGGPQTGTPPQVAAAPGLARVAGAWEGRLRGDRGPEDWRLVLREDGAYRSTTLTASGAVEQHWGRFTFADNQLRLTPEGAEPRGRVTPGQAIVIPVRELAGSRMALERGTLTRAD